MKRALQLYIATIFLLGGLSPLRGFAFGFFLAAGVLLLLLPRFPRLIARTSFRQDDWAFGLIFLLGIVPMVASPSQIGEKHLIYSAYWLSIWTVCYWWVREWIVISKINFKAVSAAAALGCVLLSSAIMIEFATSNLFGWYLSDFLYFSIDVFPQANLLGDEFLRPRGFSAEAGFTSIAFELLIPLSFGWLLKRRAWAYFFFPFVGAGYLLLASAASMSSLVASLFIYIGIRRGLWRAYFWVLIGVAALGFAILFSESFSFLLHEIVLRKYIEFYQPDPFAYADSFSRLEIYSLGINLLQNFPFGIGWGGVSQHSFDNQALLGVDLKGTGMVSMPLEIGVSAGILGLAIFALVLIRKLWRIADFPDLPARLTFFALLWVTLHHIGVLEFWFPMIWFGMALADVVHCRKNLGVKAFRRWS